MAVYCYSPQSFIIVSKRIRWWPIHWWLSTMMIHKIPLSVYYNQWLKRLDNQLNKLFNQNSIQSQNLLSQGIWKLYYKTLTSVKNNLMSPPSLRHVTVKESELSILCLMQIKMDGDPNSIMIYQGGRGHWAVYYTSPQIFLLKFSYSLAFQLWGLLTNFDG